MVSTMYWLGNLLTPLLPIRGMPMWAVADRCTTSIIRVSKPDQEGIAQCSLARPPAPTDKQTHTGTEPEKIWAACNLRR